MKNPRARCEVWFGISVEIRVNLYTWSVFILPSEADLRIAKWSDVKKFWKKAARVAASFRRETKRFKINGV